MSSPSVRIFPTVQALHRGAADAIALRLKEALARGARASLVLAGGSTPGPVYKLLAASPHAEEVPWHGVDLFWGDERPVPPDDPASNFGLAKWTLLDRIGASAEQVHRIEGELAPDVAAFRYEAEIRSVLPGAEPPQFDLVLLGIGDDGHTASLFPETDWDDARLVDSVWVPKLRTYRITMTPRLLNAARNILFLVSGAEKAPAVAQVVESPASALPARRIAPAGGHLTWLLDASAAALLTRQPTSS